MAETVQGLLDEIAAADVFDADSTALLKMLNRRWRTFVGEAKAYRRWVPVANTVADDPFYPFDPVEAYSFEVDGVPYGKARRSDVYSQEQGWLWITPDGAGLILGGADENGANGIWLVPTPGQSGLAITSFAAVLPLDLTNDFSGDSLLQNVLNNDFSEELIAGVLAAGLALREGRAADAAAYEQAFASGVARLAARVRTRYRGSTPHQIRVMGVNA